MKDPRVALDSHIRRLRMSRAEYARKLGVPKSSITYWCQGKRRPDLVSAFLIQNDTGIPAHAWIGERS